MSKLLPFLKGLSSEWRCLRLYGDLEPTAKHWLPHARKYDVCTSYDVDTDTVPNQSTCVHCATGLKVAVYYYCHVLDVDTGEYLIWQAPKSVMERLAKFSSLNKGVAINDWDRGRDFYINYTKMRKPNYYEVQLGDIHPMNPQSVPVIDLTKLTRSNTARSSVKDQFND